MPVISHTLPLALKLDADLIPEREAVQTSSRGQLTSRLIFRELRIANPGVDFRPLGDRNFAACWIIIFCAYDILYGASTSLPGLLQSLFGYDAYVSELVQSPSGVFSIVGLVVVGALTGRGVDARWLITGGLRIMATENYWIALMNLYISPSVMI
jgi:DHA2 family multidrug resistance protein